MAKGFFYLIAIQDWYTRKVLSWRLSNTMDVSFCLEALKEALQKYGAPAIINTDQGSQFTSDKWLQALIDRDVKISMDGKRRWVDNVMIERLWRSVKYECVYLHAFESGTQARLKLGEWMKFYNTERLHSSLDWRTPDEVYHAEPSELTPSPFTNKGRSTATQLTEQAA